MKKKDYFPYYVVIPVFIHFLLFYFGPFLANLWMGFTDFEFVGESKFVGFNNWISVLNDTIFWQSVWNTILFSLYYILPVMALGLCLAMIINSKIKFGKLFQGIYFLPVVTSFVVISGIWKYIFSPEPFGLVNSFLGLFNIPPQGFLNNNMQAMIVLAGLSIFKVCGTAMIYYYGGLKNIPLEVYEASDIDGVNCWQSFWHITLPLLRPTTLFVTIFITVGSFQIFDSIYLLTSGGPNYSTTTIVHQLYERGFVFLNIGEASVISIVLMSIILVLSLIQNFVINKDERSE